MVLDYIAFKAMHIKDGHYVTAFDKTFRIPTTSDTIENPKGFHVASKPALAEMYLTEDPCVILVLSVKHEDVLGDLSQEQSWMGDEMRVKKARIVCKLI